MVNGQTSSTKNNTDLVTTEIKIDGQKISRIYGVAGIQTKKELNRVPLAKVIIFDGSASEGKFNASNEALFVPGKEIEILAGYHSNNEVIFKGIIIKHGLKIRKEGITVLNLTCKDVFVRTTIVPKNNYFYDAKDSDVMSNIGNEYGLSITAEATEQVHPEIVQYAITDWDFIMMRAEANGKIAICNDGKLNIVKPDFQQESVIRLQYGVNILELDAEMDARNQFKTIKSTAWDFATQEMIEVEAKSPSIKEQGNLSSDDLAKVIDIDAFLMPNGGQSDEQELQAWTDAKWLKAQMSKIQGSVKTLGFAKIKPGDLIELDRIGERFNGNAYVSGVAHTITGGTWTTDIQFGIKPTWFVEQFAVNQNGSSRTPTIQGLQIGIVTQLEEDPAVEERILVQLPAISATEQGVWARQAFLDAGENRGWLFRPEVGDEVVVGFINDEPGQAVIVGMLHSSAHPAPIPTTAENWEKGLVTKSEMKLLFDDEKKAITIETPEGNTILLNEEEGLVSIQDQNDNAISLNADGITIKSAKDITIEATGDINLKGMNVNLEAQTQLKANGVSSATYASDGQTTIKGGMVMIN